MEQTKKDAMSATAMNSKKKHIDDAQAATVDEHFEALVKDNDFIDSEPSELAPENLPDWFDDDLFRAGQEYYQRNVLSMALAATIGVLAVLVIPTILKILVYTKQSGTSCTAFKRYFETVLHIHNLYTCNVHDGHSEWWQTLNTIRWKHSTSNRKSSNTVNGGITHRDMAITQFGFIGYALITWKELSLSNKPEEREGLNHFWRVVGYVLGISDKLNICRKNAKETTELCVRLRDEVFAKNMKQTPPHFEHMSSVLIDGLWSLDMTLDYDSFMYSLYELTGIEYPKSLSTYSWLNMQYRRCVLYLIGIPYIGDVIRIGFNHYLMLNYKLARNFPVIAWLRFGKAQSAINLYRKAIK